jgi:GT2 family glycosyltransferase
MNRKFFKDKFDWKLYVSKHKDLQRANIDTEEKAWNHARKRGQRIKEGRDIFDGDTELLEYFRNYCNTRKVKPIPNKYKKYNNQETTIMIDNNILIVMPTYNRSENIEKSIEMINNQSYKNWTFLIIDDGSLETHKTKFKEIKEKHKNNNKLIFMENETNLHIAKTLNKGIQYLLDHGSFTHFTWISDDNTYYTNFIEELQNNNTYFSYSSWDIQQLDGSKCTNKTKYKSFNDLLDNFNGCASFMWTKQAIQRTGYYTENINGCEDYEYLLRTFKMNKHACKHACKHINIPLMKYIRSSDNLFMKDKDNILNLKSKIIQTYNHIINNDINLSIVLLCFNKIEYTKQCIDSVLKNTFNDNYELIIVNNGSTDGTYEYLNKIKSNNIKIIHNKSNLGFSKGMNIGVNNTHGKYLILLNNDTIVSENWEFELIKTLESDDNIFAVTPTTNNSGNESRINVEHNSPNDFFKKVKINNYGSILNASSLALFCGAFKNHEFKNIGYLDEKYLNGWEDDDLYDRILLLNKRVVINRKSIVYHFGNVTVGKNAYNSIDNNNRLYYEKKWNVHWESCNKNNNELNKINDIIKNKNFFIFLSTQNLLTLALMIQKTLESIGITATIIHYLEPECSTDESSIYLILFYDRKYNFMPKYYIFYQIEQFNLQECPVLKFDDLYYSFMKNALLIFEFSDENIKKYIEKIDYKKILYVPFPFANLYNLETSEYKYDIVFFGAVSKRRKFVLDKLYDTLHSKYRIKYLLGIGGAERDQILMQSKYVINIHYYPDSNLEIERINTSINCNCLILSESCKYSDYNTNMYNFVKFFNISADCDNYEDVNIDNLISVIEYNLKPCIFKKNIEHLQHAKKYLENLSKFFYSKNFLSLDYYLLTKNYNNIYYELEKNTLYCLSLLENNSRYNLIKNQFPPHKIFPAIKYKRGAIGCALSYKYLLYNAERNNLPNITIFEDDCIFNDKFNDIHSSLLKINFKWDIINFFSCIIRYDNIINIYNIDNKTKLLELSNCVGAVCNIYNNSIYKYMYNFPIIQNYYCNNRFNMRYHIDRRFIIKSDLKVYCVWPFVVDVADVESNIGNDDAYSWFKNELDKTNSIVNKFILENDDKIHNLSKLT